MKIYLHDKPVAIIPLKVLAVCFALDLLLIGAILWFLRVKGIL